MEVVTPTRWIEIAHCEGVGAAGCRRERARQLLPSGAGAQRRGIQHIAAERELQSRRIGRIERARPGAERVSLAGLERDRLLKQYTGVADREASIDYHERIGGIACRVAIDRHADGIRCVHEGVGIAEPAPAGGASGEIAVREQIDRRRIVDEIDERGVVHRHHGDRGHGASGRETSRVDRREGHGAQQCAVGIVRRRFECDRAQQGVEICRIHRHRGTGGTGGIGDGDDLGARIVGQRKCRARTADEWRSVHRRVERARARRAVDPERRTAHIQDLSAVRLEIRSRNRDARDVGAVDIPRETVQIEQGNGNAAFGEGDRAVDAGCACRVEIDCRRVVDTRYGHRQRGWCELVGDNGAARPQSGARAGVGDLEGYRICSGDQNAVGNGIRDRTWILMPKRIGRANRYTVDQDFDIVVGIRQCLKRSVFQNGGIRDHEGRRHRVRAIREGMELVREAVVGIDIVAVERARNVRDDIFRRRIVIERQVFAGGIIGRELLGNAVERMRLSGRHDRRAAHRSVTARARRRERCRACVEGRQRDGRGGVVGHRRRRALAGGQGFELAIRIERIAAIGFDGEQSAVAAGDGSANVCAHAVDVEYVQRVAFGIAVVEQDAVGWHREDGMLVGRRGIVDGNRCVVDWHDGDGGDGGRRCETSRVDHREGERSAPGGRILRAVLVGDAPHERIESGIRQRAAADLGHGERAGRRDIVDADAGAAADDRRLGGIDRQIEVLAADRHMLERTIGTATRDDLQRRDVALADVVDVGQHGVGDFHRRIAFGEGDGIAARRVGDSGDRVEVDDRPVVDRHDLDRGDRGIGVERAVVDDDRYVPVGRGGIVRGARESDRADRLLVVRQRRRAGQRDGVRGRIVNGGDDPGRHRAGGE